MKHYVLTICALAICAAFLSCDDGGDSGSSGCVTTNDCSGGLFCIAGVCQEPKCSSDLDCPGGLSCLSSGKCAAGVECETADDCGNEEFCKNNKCWGTQCSIDGETKSCYNGCHSGFQTCQQGYWTVCNADKHLPSEVCDDGIDNDCNGSIDDGCFCQEGATKECINDLCGQGTSTCTGGAWGECMAVNDCCQPGTVENEACGNCGTQTRTCNDSFSWGDWGLCEGEGMCEAGISENLTCGTQCGSQVRTCSAECSWGEWSECAPPRDAICAPGETQDKACGNCGIQSKTCNDQCHWDPWENCEEGAGCNMGESQDKSCGNCGTQTRVCSQECVWGDWGNCVGEGVCASGEKDTDSCGFCGVKERTCTAQCQWGNWGSCQAGGECTPGESQQQDCGPSSSTGICKTGTQQRTCGSNCTWNSWGSCLGAIYPTNEICGDGVDQNCNGNGDDDDPDEYEPNNSCGQCYMISGVDPEITLWPTLDTPKSGSDSADYFCFEGSDDINWGLPEHIKVQLKGQPLGIDGDLFLYQGSQNCNNNSPLASSVTVGGADESIDWTENLGNDQTDTYYIKVENWSDKGDCNSPYQLYIKGLK